MIRKRKSRVFLFLLLCITVFSTLSSTEYKKKSSQTGKTEEKVAAGDKHTCAIKTDGSLWCWGDNGRGQIGDGTWKDKYSPVRIMESGVVDVAAGVFHTCAIKKDGSLWYWGYNKYGQIGDGSDENKYSPVKIIESGVVDVAAGGFHTCAIKEDGSLWCWGNNEYGQIGDGSAWKSTPVYIMNLGSDRF